MFLLLRGTSDVGIAALADLIIKRHKAWRFTTLEGLAEAAGPLAAGDDSLAAMILAECVRSLQEDGCHILSMETEEETELAKALLKELGKDGKTAFLGKAKKGSVDLVIDLEGASAEKAYTAVVPLLETMEEMPRKS